MKRRSTGARRSPIDWSVRVGLALAAIALGWVSVAHSLAQVFEDKDPARAYQLAPWDGRLAARLSEARITASQAKGDQVAISRLAQRSLGEDPTAVRAVATLGLQAQLGGEVGRARRLFAYSEKLSRRNFTTQIWAIEDSVVRGDIAGALRHYDVALRTSTSAADLLFPVLATAIADPAIRLQLISTLSRKPAWGPGFIAWIGGNGTDFQSTARLLIGLRRAGMALPAEATAGAINGLVASKSLEDAWRFYVAMRPGVDRRGSRDPRFTADLSAPSKFDWQPLNDATVVTSIQRGPRGGVFDFAVPPSGGGALLQQMQMLPAGGYRLEGHSSELEQPEVSLPYWVLTCAEGRELGRIVMRGSAQAKGNFYGQFVVPPGCPVQTLTLIARSSDSIGGVAGQIDYVRLMPARFASEPK